MDVTDIPDGMASLELEAALSGDLKTFTLTMVSSAPLTLDVVMDHLSEYLDALQADTRAASDPATPKH